MKWECVSKLKFIFKLSLQYLIQIFQIHVHLTVVF